MYVECLTSPDATRAFQDRRNAVFETAAYYGINAENAVLIGGGALALHGIDSSVELPGNPAFDLDVINVEELRGRAGLRWLHFDEEPIELYVDPNAPLQLTRVKREVSPQFSSAMGLRSYRHMLEERVVIDGLATLPISRIVAGKMWKRVPKQFMSMVKSQVTANEANHDVVKEQFWKDTVLESMVVCKSLAVVQSRRGTPDWVAELVASDYDHPAFEELRAA